jgi:anti-anti-sigma factor
MNRTQWIQQLSSQLVNITTRRTVIGDLHVLVVEGEVDMSTIPQLSDALTRLVADSRGASTAVDLDGVQVLDDTALGVLLGIAGRARQSGGELVVVCTSEKMRARLEQTRFDRAVTVRSTISDI